MPAQTFYTALQGSQCWSTSELTVGARNRSLKLLTMLSCNNKLQYVASVGSG